MINVVSRSAEISPCGKYRYHLARTLMFGQGTCVFVMLNPSTADGLADDQTIRRCLGYTFAWGFHRLEVVNLFAWRATDPKDMKSAIDPIGPLCDQWIERAAKSAQLVICAWGNHGGYLKRDKAVASLLRGSGITLHRLTVTKRGHPGHPLMLAEYLKAQEWPA